MAETAETRSSYRKPGIFLKKIVAVFDGEDTDALNAMLCSTEATPRVIGFADDTQARQIRDILAPRSPRQ